VIARDTVTADALATVVGVDGLDHPRVTTLLARTDAAALVVSDLAAVGVSSQWPERVDPDIAAKAARR
jgi:thiamine biosynthesis lipoprotein ApbE